MTEVLAFHDVSVVRDGRAIIDRCNWVVTDAERWVILGPNGAGKSTLLGLAAAYLHPTRGQVHILGERLGRVDVNELRPRIGLASSAMADRLPRAETVRDAVLTAVYGVTGRWHEAYDEIDDARVDEVLEQWQLLEFADRRFGTLSDGERKRVSIARAVMSDPELLLMDEPSAALDLGARERLLASFTDYATSEFAPAIVMVTHHVEEIPAGITHAMLLREGEIVAAGPIRETLTGANLEATFGLPLTVHEESGRFTARALA